MPSRGSWLAVAVPRTTLSAKRTTTEPCACLANLPVSNEMVLPPVNSTVTDCGSGFIPIPSKLGAPEGPWAVRERGAGMRERPHANALRRWCGQKCREDANLPSHRRWYRGQTLLADAKFRNYAFVALGVVFLEVVEQTTPLADQHQKAAPGRVVLFVRLEVLRQLANALTQEGDLDLGAAGIADMGAVLVNDGLLMLSG